MLCLVFLTPIYAQNKDSLYYFEDAISSHLIYENMYSCDDLYYLGNDIPIYLSDSDNVLSLYTDVKLYPVFCNDELILTLMYYDNTIKISDMFVDILKAHLGTATKIMIIKSCNDLKLVADSKVYSFDMGEYSYLTELDESYKGAYERMNNYDNRKLLLSIQNGSRSSYSIALPTRAQSPYALGCWAACIASFDSYYNHHTTYVSDVVYAVTGSTSSAPDKSPSQVCTILQYYYDIMAYQRNVNSSSFCSNVRTDIQNGKGYILCWQKSSGEKHATVLKGYTSSGSSYQYHIMDPFYNSSMGGGVYSLYKNNSTDFPHNNSIFEVGNNNPDYYLYDSIYFGYLIVGAK